MKQIIRYCAFLALALPGVAAAQQPTFSVADAVATARARHPLVRAAAGRVEATRGAARQQGAFPNPTLEWRSEHLDSPLGVDRFLTAELPVDLSGRRLSLRSAGRAAVEGAVADSIAAIREIEYAAAAAYWNAALAEALLETAIAQREALEGIAAFDSIRLSEGAVAEVAAIRTRLEADRARLAEATARAEAARAHAELARALGLPQDSVPGTEPLTVPTPELPALEEAIRHALATRPDLRASAAMVESARLQRNAERWAMIPEFSVVGGWKETAGFRTGVLGVSVPIPLFDRNGGARARAAGEFQMAEAVHLEAEARARAEVAASLAAVESLLAAMPPDGADIAARGLEVAAIAEAMYREGGASLLELLEAQRSAADARASALRWATELRLALLDLNRATGAPILENQ